ncbi:MAG: glycosyltransferase, partial [Casimicrobiaceae bacterium]
MTPILSRAKVALALLRRHLRIAGASPTRWLWVLWRGASIVGGGGLAATIARHSADLALYAQYPQWHRRHLALDTDDHAQITARIAKVPGLPLLSVIMPTYNTPVAWLDAAVRSVEQQLYPRWELCIVDDCSTSETTRGRIRELAADARIHTQFLA